MQTFTDQERATIARGWAASGLPQDQYAARYSVTGRCLRGWLKSYAPSQPPIQRVEAIVAEAMAKLQAVLDDVRSGPEGRAEDRTRRWPAMEGATAIPDGPYRPEGRAEQDDTCPKAGSCPAEVPDADGPPEPTAIAATGAGTQGGYFDDFR